MKCPNPRCNNTTRFNLSWVLRAGTSVDLSVDKPVDIFQRAEENLQMSLLEGVPEVDPDCIECEECGHIEGEEHFGDLPEDLKTLILDKEMS